MVPLEKAQREPDPGAPRRKRALHRTERPAGKPRRHSRREPIKTATTPLPPGHVRKRTTGEIGKVQAVDPKAGTATVRWLRQGSTSTVPLSAISRR
jgi:hypothetical protein